MTFRLKPIAINKTSIDTGLWAIQRYGMQHYGTDAAAQDIAPLTWYINTGRATLEFSRKLLNAKPFMVARKLHEGGSYDEAIRRIKDYIGYEEESV